jgi:hypothetical protein
MILSFALQEKSLKASLRAKEEVPPKVILQAA